MKKCKICLTVVNDLDRFCSYCGNADFYSEDNKDCPIQFTVYPNGIAPNGDGAEVRYFSDIPNHIENQNIKKKKSKIIGIAGAVILLLVAIVFSIDILFDNNYKETMPNEFSDKNEQSVAFSLGEIVDGVYLNEWADLSFDLENTWENATDEYKKIENEFVSCGFYAKHNSNTLTIAFVKVSEGETNSEVLAEEYLDIYMKSVKDSMELSEISENKYSIIGGYSYICSEASGFVNGYDMIITSGVRTLEDYVILISVTGIDSDDNYTIIDKINSYDGF